MRKGELIFNYTVILCPPMLTVIVMLSIKLAGMLPETTFWGAIMPLLFGFLIFAKAKLSVIKQGQFFSLGTSQMSKQNRISYFMGYAAMCLGFFLLIGFALTAR